MSKVQWINLIPYPNRRDYATGDHVVYLVYASSADLYKIGWTEALKERMWRMNQDQRDIPGPFKVVHSIRTESGRYLERQLHLLFAHRHSIREWFRLTSADVQWIRHLGHNLPKGIPIGADVVPPLAEWTD